MTAHRRTRLGDDATATAARSSFKLRELHRTRTRPQRIVVHREEDADRRVERSLRVAVRRVNDEFKHERTRVTLQMAARLRTAQFVPRSFHHETSLCKQRQEREAVIRHDAHQAIDHFEARGFEPVCAVQRKVKRRRRITRRRQPDSHRVMRTTNKLVESACPLLHCQRRGRSRSRSGREYLSCGGVHAFTRRTSGGGIDTATRSNMRSRPCARAAGFANSAAGCGVGKERRRKRAHYA